MSIFYKNPSYPAIQALLEQKSGYKPQILLLSRDA
jgi:hypothetical protein